MLNIFLVKLLNKPSANMETRCLWGPAPAIRQTKSLLMVIWNSKSYAMWTDIYSRFLPPKDSLLSFPSSQSIHHLASTSSLFICSPLRVKNYTLISINDFEGELMIFIFTVLTWEQDLCCRFNVRAWILLLWLAGSCGPMMILNFTSPSIATNVLFRLQ